MSKLLPGQVSSGLGVELRVSAMTNVGLKRSVNEDSLLAQWPVFIVADGMGGHSAGDRASAAIVEEFSVLVGRKDVSAGDIESVVKKAQTAVVAISQETSKGAGSTLSGLVMLEYQGQPIWAVINVGDSRVYRLALDGLEQVTKDHSLVQEQIDAGELTADQAQLTSGRNVITRAIGADESQPDFSLRPVCHGERLLVCTDGLSALVLDDAIEADMTLAGGTEATAQALVAHALENGGKDNVSVIVIDVVSGGAPMFSDQDTTEIFPFDVEDTVEVNPHTPTEVWDDDTVELPPRIAGSSHE